MAVFDFLPGTIPAGEHLAELDTYTPVLTATTTNPNLGADGFISGWWHRIGKRRVDVEVRLLFSGTGVAAGSGFYEISLPLPADTSLMTASTTVGSASSMGAGQLRDNSPTTVRVCTVILRSATLLRIISEGVSSVTDASPWTWATGDRISLNFRYMIEPGV